jgi:glutamine amidotransferase-like uncharacterized protein
MNKITNTTSVSPAYGRDYKSASAARLDFEAGKDFEIHTLFRSGTYCSIRDFAKGTRVHIRYNKQQKVAEAIV